MRKLLTCYRRRIYVLRGAVSVENVDKLVSTEDIATPEYTAVILGLLPEMARRGFHRGGEMRWGGLSRCLCPRKGPCIVALQEISNFKALILFLQNEWFPFQKVVVNASKLLYTFNELATIYLLRKNAECSFYGHLAFFYWKFWKLIRGFFTKEK